MKLSIRYSLRSLMIVVTLVCVVFGGRIEYLRRMAGFHERKAERLAVEINRLTGWHAQKVGFVPFRINDTEELLLSRVRAHEEFTLEYRQAVARPRAKRAHRLFART